MQRAPHNTSHTDPPRKGVEVQANRKRRGNPQWAQGMPTPLPTVSEFERIVERLRLKPHEYTDSQELRDWAEKNKDIRFVPERLLKAWGIPLRRNIEDFI